MSISSLRGLTFSLRCVNGLGNVVCSTTTTTMLRMLIRNKNYSFSLFCMANSFVKKDVVVQVDVVGLMVLIISHDSASCINANIIFLNGKFL